MGGAVKYESLGDPKSALPVGAVSDNREISCRIFPEKTLLFIEEIFLVQLDRKMRISAETASVQRLLGPADVAKWLGVSSGWVRDHATRKEPRLKSVKVGKLLRFRPEDIEEFLRIGADESRPQGAAAAVGRLGQVAGA